MDDDKKLSESEALALHAMKLAFAIGEFEQRLVDAARSDKRALEIIQTNTKAWGISVETEAADLRQALKSLAFDLDRAVLTRHYND